MKNRFKIELGDPSNDGHGKCETFVVKSNKTIEEIENAYKRSCELTGLVFTENTDVIVNGEKMKWQHPEYNDRKLCVEYESFDISKLAWEILEKHGLDRKTYLIQEEEDLEDEGLLSLFLDFIKLTLPDLEYEIEEDELETLGLTIGYGRFD